MPQVSEKAMQQIDSMTESELLCEKNLKQRSRFQNENYAYLLSRLEIIQIQENKNFQQETLNNSKQANDIAVYANSIAKKIKKNI